MKYNININQLALKDSGLDLQTCAVLDYLKCLCASTNNKVTDKKIGDYFWVSLSKLKDDMPLLGIKTIAGISVKIKKLKKFGFVETKIVRTKETGTKTLMYLRLTPKTRLLDFTTKEEADKLQLTAPSTTVDSSHQLQLTNNNTIEDNNTKINTSEQAHEPTLKKEEPFDFNSYISGVLKNSKGVNNTRYFAAYFLKRKGLSFNSSKSTEAAMARHYRAAKQLAEFTSDPKLLSDAFNKAENLTIRGEKVNWGLETVLKMLTS